MDMEQLMFFKEEGQTPGLPPDLLQYHSSVFSSEESDIILNALIEETPWHQKLVKMYEKDVLTPRLTAWYANEDTYDYTSLRRSSPNVWTRQLIAIKKRIELVTKTSFNSVLLNYYRDGNDSVAWHSDNEKALGTHPLIASVSFGQVRSFDIRSKNNHAEKYSIRLESGSLLLMKGDLQQHWEHRVAKSVRPMKRRLNLTFRVVI
jgi:alkylated DNA repair dioxygenase AlkB